MTPDAPTCMVTGALGFLGSRIAHEFARAGYRVRGLDRVDAGPDSIAESGISVYTRLDLPSARLAGLLASEQPDVIIHAAGPASVGDSIIDPMADFRGNVGVLFELLDAAREHAPHACVVILSSAAVYGDPERLPIAESATIAPLSPYGFHKQIAETILREFHQIYGIRTAAARVFSAYGPGLRRQILWDVCRKASGGSVRLFGTGAETRDFIHAEDVALAIRTIVDRAPMRGEAYNVASGVETRIRDLAVDVAARVSPGTPVVFSGDARPGDPLRWRADISAIESLGFTPSVSLVDGIAGYCAWYRDVAE